jgi:hypothetical protein
VNECRHKSEPKLVHNPYIHTVDGSSYSSFIIPAHKLVVLDQSFKRRLEDGERNRVL